MNQAPLFLVLLLFCGCAGTMAPRKQVAQAKPAKEINSIVPSPPVFHSGSSKVYSPGPDKVMDPGQSFPLVPLEAPAPFLDPDKTTVSGSVSVSVGYEHVDSRVDRIGRQAPGPSSPR